MNKARPSEMRRWLVAAIDRALSVAPRPDPTIVVGKPYRSRGKTEFHGARGKPGEIDYVCVTVRQIRDSAWGVYVSRGVRLETLATFEADGPAAARDAASVLLGRVYVEDGDVKLADPEMVAFDVPGGGQFSAVNTIANLEAFRKRVLTSPGFRDRRA